MSKPWNPRDVRRKPEHVGWADPWDRRARARPGKGRSRRGRGVSAGEARLVLLGGLFLGLVYAAAPALRSGTGEVLSPASAPASPAAVRVIDGDTFDYRGERIRIADIDTPETHPPRCADEAELGMRATRRLGELLKAGPFELQPIDRDEDRYGRKLRIVVRDGESVGAVLVSEGLARPWEGHRRPWCG